MAEYPKQIVVPVPLWDFMRYCEIYCGAACCGVGAFEIHPAMLLRRVADLNIAEPERLSGRAAFLAAWKQAKELAHRFGPEELQGLGNDVPIWHEASAELPEYWLERDQVKPWIQRWQECFVEASKFQGVGPVSADELETIGR